MLKDKVKEYILRHNSGAIYIRKHTLGGSISLNFEEIKVFMSSRFPTITLVVEFSSAKADLSVSYYGYIHPMSEEGWNCLEDLFQNPVCDEKDRYEVRLNSQDASFSIENFAGLLDVSHDESRIRKDQRKNDQDRLFAGYGKTRMGGWVG
jgi:hypothetical protein